MGFLSKLVEKCYLCGSVNFFANPSQIRCAKCGRFHCQRQDYKGKILTGQEVASLQKFGGK